MLRMAINPKFRHPMDMWLRRIIATVLLCAGLASMPGVAPRAADDLTLVVVGDSLSAGYGLAATDAFPAKLGLDAILEYH